MSTKLQVLRSTLELLIDQELASVLQASDKVLAVSIFSQSSPSILADVSFLRT
jgi:hypothetical protein